MTSRAARYVTLTLMMVGCCWEVQAAAVRDWTVAVGAAPWVPRSGHAAVDYLGKIWLIGGQQQTGGIVGDVWSTTDGVRWSAAIPWPGSKPTGRAGHTAVVFAGKLWLIGGAGSLPGSNVWYSANGTTWTRATANAPWRPRTGHGSVVFNNKMWVIGGGDYFRGFFNDVWWSSNGTSWTCATASAPWSPGMGGVCVVHGGRMWVLGVSPTQESKEVWCSFDGKNWTRVVANAPWRGYGGIGAVTAGGKIWVMGGNVQAGDEVASTNDIWCSADGANWREVTPHAAWSGRAGFPLVVHNRKIWLLGGYTFGSGSLVPTYLNDVWYTDLPTETTTAWKLYR